MLGKRKKCPVCGTKMLHLKSNDRFVTAKTGLNVKTLVCPRCTRRN